MDNKGGTITTTIEEGIIGVNIRINDTIRITEMTTIMKMEISIKEIEINLEIENYTALMVN